MAAGTQPQEGRLNARVVPRPRVRQRIVELVERFGVVWVLGSAGSGKTTAVTDAVAALGGPTAWLTLEATELAPGRLLLHLERALSAALDGLPPAVTEALEAKVPHVESAGYLAEAIGEREVVLVIDELERLADADADAEPVRVVLASFVRRLAPSVRVLLISGRGLPLHLGGGRDIGGVGYVSERDLALTVAEAEQVLQGLDRNDRDADAVVRATGGWVAGVLFEAWRSSDHVHGSGGEADALSGYLSSEIMLGLDERQQWFLLATSLLLEVTADRAQRLGLTAAREVLAGLRGHRIPVELSADGTRLRCHPRFREYLRRRLDDRDGAEVAALHVAHGRLLLAENLDDEAVDAFLRGGDLDAAETAAERALPAVLRRGDVGVADRWLRAFRPPTIATSVVLTGAELAVALEGEAWTTGAAAVDRLLTMLKGDPTPVEPELAGVIGTCFLHVGRFEDVATVIASARPGPARTTWEFALSLDLAERPVHYRDRPADRGETVDGLLHRYDLMHGRFERLLSSHPAPWAAARSSRVRALRAVGRIDDALALLEDWPAVEESPAMTRISIELLVDLGRVDEAWRALEHGRVVAERSSPYCVLLHHLQEASLALRTTGDVDRARRALDRADEDPTARQRTRVLEQLDLLRGLAALLAGEDELAAAHLRAAVATMRAHDRQLLMPTAAVHLAEAEWRLGEEEAADAAADLALRAARVQGSDHLLLQALHQHPAVLARRIDAEAETDSAWHAIGRSMLADGPVDSARGETSTHVHEFGVPSIVCGGRPLDPRLSRSFEVLAHLAAHGGCSSKTMLLDDLFEGRTDDRARAYLRQALKRVRDVLPEGVTLDADGPDVRWTGGPLSQ